MLTKSFVENYPLLLARKAEQCVRILKCKGLEIKMIAGSLQQPRVIIKPSPLCECFDGVAHAYSRLKGKEERYAQVFVHGCEVRWAE